LGVRTRISFYNGQREEARTAAQTTAAPWRADLGPRLLWEAADTIWTALGDKSTDGNWYSKRMVLSAVIGSTLSTWLAQEDDEDDQIVWDYLDDRIENVMQFEKFKAQANECLAKAPNPLDILKFMPNTLPFRKS
jgi:ubiquinone biosynthesis protein COQ9